MTTHVEASADPRPNQAEGASERTVPGLFRRRVAESGDRVALRRFDGDRWVDFTWADFDRAARAVAAALVAEGVQPGDRVVLMSPNRIEWLYCDMGVQLAGGVDVPVYPSTTASVAAKIVANSEARVAIVSDAEIASRLRGAEPLEKVFTMDEDVQGWLASGPAPAALAEIDRRTDALEPDSIGTIIYTSGTTGDPKGVVLEQRAMADMAVTGVRSHNIGPDDVTLSFLPYSHVLERVNGLYVGIAAGGCAYLSRGIDRLAEDIREVRPTVMVSVPRVYEKMHQRVLETLRTQPERRQAMFRWAVSAGEGRRSRNPFARASAALADRLLLAKVRDRLTGGRLRFFVSGGAPLHTEVERFFWAIGVPILQGWGMTETSSGATSNLVDHHRYGTVGLPLPGVELKIAEDGEILVKSPGNMREYYRNPEATAETIKDGWVVTGDIGEIDSDGFLTITDRKKDLIKTAGGKYVAPQPIEARLQAHEGIERAVVIGDERPYVVALIVPDWDALGIKGDHEAQAGSDDLKQRFQSAVDEVNRDLGSWETIKYFHVLPADFSEEKGELTPTLKAKRKVIHENHRDAIESMYEGKRRPAGENH